MLKDSKKYIQVAGEIFRVDPKTMFAEALTPEGTWISADDRPTSLFMEIMDGIHLSDEEITSLPS